MQTANHLQFHNCSRALQREIYASGVHGPGVPQSTPAGLCDFLSVSVSSEISNLLLFVSYFASQSKGIKFGKYFFDVCCVNLNFLVRRQIPTSYSTGISINTERYWS